MVRVYHRAHKSSVLAMVVCATIIAAQARATIVAPMELHTIADHSGQVIDARVVSARSYWAQNPTRIESELILAPVEFLKGAPSVVPTTLSLIVPGGSVGSKQMRIAGAPELKVGDRWILCLLPTYKTFPVVGITRGAFRVVADEDATLRMADAAGNPVTGIDHRGFVQVAANRATSMTAESPAAEADQTRGLTRDEFAAMLRPILDASKAYDLAHPAGKRVLVQYTPVPFGNQLGTAAATARQRHAPPTIRQGAAEQRESRIEPKSTRTGEPR